MFQQSLFTDFAQPREIVQDRFPDFLAPEIGVELVGEAMSLVPDPLEQAQTGIPPSKLELSPAVGEKDGFLSLGQANQGRGPAPQRLEGQGRRRHLSGSAVHHDEIGKPGILAQETAIATPDDFLHGPKVVISLKTTDLEPEIAALMGLSREELDHGGNHEGSRHVRDVEALDRARRMLEAERLLKVGHFVPGSASPFGPVPGEAAGLLDSLGHGVGNVAQLGRPLKIHLLSPNLHLPSQFLQPSLGLSLQKETGPFNALAVFLNRGLIVLGEDFSPGIVVKPHSAIAKPDGLGIGQQNTEILAHLGQGGPNEVGLHERTVVAGAIRLAVAAKSKAREIVLEVDPHQHKLFVIGEKGVVLGLILLDQLTLQQECLGLGIGLVSTDLADHLDHGGNFWLALDETTGTLKIATYATPQVFGLPNVNYAAKAVLHQVHPGRLRQRPSDFAQLDDLILHWQSLKS